MINSSKTLRNFNISQPVLWKCMSNTIKSMKMEKADQKESSRADVYESCEFKSRSFLMRISLFMSFLCLELLI